MRPDERSKGKAPPAGETPVKQEPSQDKWAVVIAVVLMAIFLTWIGCAIAVYMGWAI